MTTLNSGAPRDPLEIEERLWRRMLPAELAFDVGANMGQSVERMLIDSEEAAKQVVAFEPAHESYDVMRENVGDDPRVILANFAVATHDGMLTTSVRQAPIQTGQLVAVGMPYYAENPQEAGMARWGGETDYRSVPCFKLDTLVRDYGQPDFVKVDTEGHELQVLIGGLRLIAEQRTRWLVEFHREDLYFGCRNILEYFGYDVETIRHPHYSRASHMRANHGWIRAFPGETNG